MTESFFNFYCHFILTNLKMKIMKIVKNIIIKLFLLCPIFLFAQNSKTVKVKLGSDGKIMTPVESRNFLGTLHYSVDDTALCAELQTQLTGLKKDILGRLWTTIENIENNPDKYSFIGKRDLVVAKYRMMLNELNNKSERMNLELFPNLKNTFSYLDSLEPIISSSTIAGNKKQIIVYQPIISNQFYAKYFNIIRNDPKNAIFKSYLDGDLKFEHRHFVKLRDSLDKFLKLDSLDVATKIANELKASKIFIMFSEPWLVDLLWLTKGTPSVNPFYPLKEVVGLNKVKTDSVYLAYLANQITNRIKPDTTNNYKEFREILDEQIKTEIRLSPQIIQAGLDSIYNINLKKLKIGYSQMNKIQFPLDSPKNVVYHLILANNQKTEDDIYKEDKITNKDKQIKWFVHNLTSEQKVFLKDVEKKKIVSTNEFEDEMSSLLNQVASVYSLFDPGTLLGITSSLGGAISDSKTQVTGAFLNKDGKLNSKEYNKFFNKEGNLNLTEYNEFKNFVNTLELLNKVSKETESERKKRLEKKLQLDTTLRISVLYSTILKAGSQLISEDIPQLKSDKPILKTLVTSTPETEELTSYSYQLNSVVAKDTTIIDGVKLRVGASTYFTLSAGIGYSFSSPTTQHLSTDANGKNIFKAESRSVNALVGINFYPWKLKKPTEFFPADEWLNRLFVQVGLGFPKPIDNIFTGIGVNLGPGILVSAGAHFYSQKKYEIFNDVVTREKRFFKTAPYISLGIDPTLFLKAIGLFGEKK